jgi:hypothetical protein
VAPFDIPMTVRVEGGRVRLLVRLTRPLGWSRVRAAVCAAAGLPEGTTLHFGAGAIPDHWTVGMPPLVAGCEIATFADDEVPERPPVMLTVLAGPDAGACVPMGTRSVRVGRDAAADLVLTDAAVSLRHAVIEPTATGLVVRDMRSTNGVFVDGVPVDGVTMAGTGSIIRIGNGVLQVQLTAEPAGAFRPDGAGHLVRDRRARRAAEAPTVLPAPPSAPEPRTRRGLPLISAAVGGAVGGVLALVLRNPLFLAFAAFGPLTMIGTAVGDRVRGRRSYRRQRTGYAADLAEMAGGGRGGGRRESSCRVAGMARTGRTPAVRPDRRRTAVGPRPRRPDYLRLAVGSGARTVPVPGASVAGGRRWGIGRRRRRRGRCRRWRVGACGVPACRGRRSCTAHDRRRSAASQTGVAAQASVAARAPVAGGGPVAARTPLAGRTPVARPTRNPLRGQRRSDRTGSVGQPGGSG